MPLFGWVDAEVVAVFIPIVAVLGGVFIAVTAVVMNGRRKELEHRERILALEKGVALPTEVTVEGERPKHSGRRANGLVMTGIGLALTIALWAEEGAEGGLWGLIPLFIGIGLLVAGSLDKREWEAQQRRTNSLK